MIHIKLILDLKHDSEHEVHKNLIIKEKLFI